MSILKQIKSSMPAPLRASGRSLAGNVRRCRKLIRSRLGRPDVYALNSQERSGIVYDNPSEMTVPERMFLYSLVRGSRPKTILEIGSRHGGSASIMAAALMDIDARTSAKIYGVDPGPEITVPERRFFGRFDLTIEPSPQGITTAAAKAGQPFDFVLIDGLHIYTQLKLDLLGALPYLADETYILLHDAFHHGVSKAIREILESEPRLIDCGYPCGKPALGSKVVAYGGFRMLRFAKNPIIDAQAMIEREAAKRGVPAPGADDDLADHDPYWFCKRVQPCAYCKKNGLNGTPH